MTDADRWEYQGSIANYGFTPVGWELNPDVIGNGWQPSRYRRLRYPRFATLADIPITPGRTQHRGCTESDGTLFCQVEWSAGHGHWYNTAPGYVTHNALDAQIEFICDLFAPVVGSDEAWLRKRGKFTAWEQVSGLWAAIFESEKSQFRFRGYVSRDIVSADIRRGVEAIEGGGEGWATTSTLFSMVRQGQSAVGSWSLRTQAAKASALASGSTVRTATVFCGYPRTPTSARDWSFFGSMCAKDVGVRRRTERTGATIVTCFGPVSLTICAGSTRIAPLSP